LVHNVPECNGKVGIVGISYNGFLALMALVDPHPALKVQRVFHEPGRASFVEVPLVATR